MMKIPKKVIDRFASTLKHFQTVAASHKSWDVSEADTVPSLCARTGPIVSAVRRELRRLFPEMKVDLDDITDILTNDVLKREVIIDGDKVKEAQQKIKKASSKIARATAKKVSKNNDTDTCRAANTSGDLQQPG